MQVCKHCRRTGDGNYCFNCGEIYQPARITLHSLLHEVVHTITHADKGFFYTLKNLATRPGLMQKNYLQGERKTNQKPFSLFFICASIAAITLHYVNATPPGTETHYDIVKSSFYKNYFVICQTLLLPFYALLTWLVFYGKKLNYAEALVLFMYSLAFSMLIIIPVDFFGYFFKSANEQAIELVLLGIYMIWTNINFFRPGKKWLLVLKSILLLVCCYATSYFTADLVINLMI